MKRTLTISLWLALGAVAVAQNPVVVRNDAQTAVMASSQTAKPAPAAVKVVPVTKSVVAKPVVVAAKPAVVKARPVVVSAKPAVQVKPTVVAAKSGAQSKPTVVALQAPSKAMVHVKPAPSAGKPVAVVVPAGHASGASKAAVVREAKPKVVAVAKPESGKSAKSQVVAVKSAPAGKTDAGDKADDKKAVVAPPESVAQNGRRDPFISPIVTMGSLGSGCSTGKRCLAIDQVYLKGIVKSEVGMIAVVVNSAEKAYFLRENDPVFNGYVVKITGDSIVFKETSHDKFGKPLTRDVTKTISRPVA